MNTKTLEIENLFINGSDNLFEITNYINICSKHVVLLVPLAQKNHLDLSVSLHLPFTALPSLLCLDPVPVTFVMITVCVGVCMQCLLRGCGRLFTY